MNDRELPRSDAQAAESPQPGHGHAANEASARRGTHSVEQRIELVLRLMSREASAEELAELHGVCPSELEDWRALFMAGARGSAALGPRKESPSRSGMRARAVIFVAVTAGMTAFFYGAPELSRAACSQLLPSPMVTFCAGAPARANDMNANLQQLISWIEMKLGGPLQGSDGKGSSNVNVAGALTAGSVATGSVSASGSLSVAGNIYQGSYDFVMSQPPGDSSRGDGGRALVHDGGDTLVVNYAGDFSGGTRVQSALSVDGRTYLNGGLTSQSTASFGGDVNASGNASIGGSASISGPLYAGGGTISTALDASGYQGYGSGYNDTWASCGSGVVHAVRARRSDYSDQMVLEVQCSY